MACFLPSATPYGFPNRKAITSPTGASLALPSLTLLSFGFLNTCEQHKRPSNRLHIGRHASLSEHKTSISTPLVDAVAERGDRHSDISFHVPGHKRGKRVPPAMIEKLHLDPSDSILRYDLTELKGLDYLSSPDGPILEAQRLASAAYSTHSTWFLVNGTTVGIHAAIMATCIHTKDCIILPRNAHVSAFNATVLAGCHVVYSQPHSSTNIAHFLTAESLEDAFERAHSEGFTVKAALVVSPTYFGVISDVSRLAKVCQRHGAVLIVDEAHGAHLKFSNHASLSAIDNGADIVIQSTHKTLGALTQAAMIHLCRTRTNNAIIGTLEGRISRALQILQTSSPSYVIMSSLDAARAQAVDGGSMVVDEAAKRVEEWYRGALADGRIPPHKKFQLLGRYIEEEGNAWPEAVQFDNWRITVLFPFQSLMTGWTAASILEQRFHLVPELATYNAVVYALGIGSTVEDAEALCCGLEWLATDTGWNEALKEVLKSDNTPVNQEPQSSVQLPRVVLTPREAFYAQTERISMSQANGRISAELLCPYPPGVPLIYPGERIEEGILQQLRSVVRMGGKVVGCTDGSLETILVCCEVDENNSSRNSQA